MSIKHPCTTIDSNAVNARNIARSIIGKGCNYADGRKGGVRYKWLVREYGPALFQLKMAVNDALNTAGIKNFKVNVHTVGYDAISVTVMAV